MPRPEPSFYVDIDELEADARQIKIDKLHNTGAWVLWMLFGILERLDWMARKPGGGGDDEDDD